MSTLPTPAFTTTANQNAAVQNQHLNDQSRFLQSETNRKLQNFTVKELAFTEEEVQNRIKNLVNREYPQPYPLKSQMPESFSSEFVMTPISLVEVQR